MKRSKSLVQSFILVIIFFFFLIFFYSNEHIFYIIFRIFSGLSFLFFKCPFFFVFVSFMFLLFVLFVIYIYIFFFTFFSILRFFVHSFLFFIFRLNIFHSSTRADFFVFLIVFKWNTERSPVEQTHGATYTRARTHMDPRAGIRVHAPTYTCYPFFFFDSIIAYYWVHIGLSVGGRNFSWRIHMRPNQLYARRRSKQGKNGVSRHATDH